MRSCAARTCSGFNSWSGRSPPRTTWSITRWTWCGRAGPRAAQYLVLAAKARALLHGRLAVHAGDLRAMARPVLRHRIFTNFNADAEGMDADQILDKLLQAVPEPAYGERPAPVAPIPVPADSPEAAKAVPVTTT